MSVATYVFIREWVLTMVCLHVRKYDNEYNFICVTKDSKTRESITDKEIQALGFWDAYNNVKTIIETKRFGNYCVYNRYKYVLDFFVLHEYGHVSGDDDRFDFVIDLEKHYDLIKNHYLANDYLKKVMV